MIYDKTGDSSVVEDLNAIDDQMGDEVTLRGLVLRKFLIRMNDMYQKYYDDFPGGDYHKVFEWAREISKEETYELVKDIIDEYIEHDLSFNEVDKIPLIS